MRYLIALLIVASLPIQAQFDATSADFEKQTISIALAQEPPQLNGMKATDQVSIFMLSHVMEGLVRYDRRGNVVPGVAERWEIDDTGATFWLREEAIWSDWRTQKLPPRWPPFLPPSHCHNNRQRNYK